MQVCIPKDWTDFDVIQFAENNYPCGTRHGWSVRKATERLAGYPERNACAERQGFVHIMLDA